MSVLDDVNELIERAQLDIDAVDGLFTNEADTIRDTCLAVIARALLALAIMQLDRDLDRRER